MARLKVITYGNPVLRKKATKVDAITDEIRQIVHDMEETLESENGIGLAAPQVGISKKLFLVDLSKSGENRKVVLVNPKIIYKSPYTHVSEEGCLSIPKVYGAVRRPEEVRIKGKLLNGKTIIIEGEGLFGRALQHEFDHLEGKLFIDYLSKEDLDKNREKIDAIVAANRTLLGDVTL